MNASMSFKRLDSRLIFVSEFVFAMSSRTFTTSDGRSIDFKSSWTASAPMRASNSSPCSSMDSRYISSVSNCPRCSEVMPGSTTTKASKYSTRSISRRVMSSMRPMRDGSDFRNQMCAVGLANSIWPMRSRRTLD